MRILGQAFEVSCTLRKELLIFHDSGALAAHP